MLLFIFWVLRMGGDTSDDLHTLTIDIIIPT